MVMIFVTSFFALSFIMSFVISYPSHSADIGSNTQFGLAMHGDPLHSPDSPALSYTDPKAHKGGDIHYAAIGGFDTLNPYALKGNPAQGLHLVYERLMARAWDEPFTLYPLIAKGYNVAPDRSFITFYIDERAKFSDGTAITTADIAYSFHILKKHGRPNFRRVYDLVDKISYPESGAITFNLKPGYDQETIMILAIMPVLSKNFWQDRDFNDTLLVPPVSSGPYHISTFEPGREITYTRRKNYWGDQANIFSQRRLHNFNAITFDYFRDKNIAYEAFQNGLISLWREDDPSRWSRRDDIGSSKIKTKTFPHQRPERVQAFIFNTRLAPFDNINIRRAISLAFQADWVNRNLYANQYKRTASIFPNSELAAKNLPSAQELTYLSPWKDQLPASVFGPAYAPATDLSRNEYRQNLKQANFLLNESGWVISNGKRIHKKTKQEFTFEVIINDKQHEKIALSLSQSLKKLGITMTIRILDSASFIGRLNQYNYDMALHFWQSSLSPGTEQILYWGCDAANENGRWNFAGICHPALDDLAKKLAFSRDREDLKTLAHAMDRIIMHHHIMIPLFYRGADWVLFNKELRMPDTTPIYGIVQESWWKTLQNQQ